MRRHTWAAGLAAVVIVLTGCASQEDSPDVEASDEPTASSTPSGASPSPSATSPAPAPAGTTVEITIKGDDVTPSGKTVQVDVGDPVRLAITSDAAGELHVHSTPDQEVTFVKGTSTHELTFDRPGVVEVEDHHSGKVIVKLEVR